MRSQLRTRPPCRVAIRAALDVQLHHVISDLTGVTGVAIADVIVESERDPARSAALANRGIRASRESLIKALQGKELKCPLDRVLTDDEVEALVA